MTATVYFCSARARSESENKLQKIKRLALHAGLEKIVNKDDFCAIKLHFGEPGNDTHLHPGYARQIVDLVKEFGGKPFLTDTNTLYSGPRQNAAEHLVAAYENGFSYSVVKAPILIADGLTGTNVTKVPVNGKHFKEVSIASDILSANCMVVLSHVKGHELAGFGGAIKNLAMGCAPAVGKQEQHQLRFHVDSKTCNQCGSCEKVCPTKAILEEKNGSRKINEEKCIGCGECSTVCQIKAISAVWETDIPSFMERMAEYALGALYKKENNVIYINFLQNITPDCDCVPWSDSLLVPDIGILASTDPVAIDKASHDLITKAKGLPTTLATTIAKEGEDKFAAIWDYTQGLLQVTYAEELKMGTQAYNLVTI